MIQASGAIGSFLDEDVPIKYLVRYLTSSFLLSGHIGSLIPDRSVRVSIKVLALNCVGLAVTVMPSLLAQPLFVDAVGEPGKKNSVLLTQDNVSDLRD